MMHSKTLSYLIACLFIFTECKEPIEFDESGLPQKLVVAGQVISGPQVQWIELMSIEGSEQVALTNASVSVIEFDPSGDFLTSYGLEHFEFRPGLYVSGFEGVVGNSYQLVVDAMGRTFRSSIERMLPVAQISEISGNDVITDDGTPLAQIMVSASGTNTESQYYKWEYTEVYEIRVPYPSWYVWDNGPVYRGEPLGPCWKYNRSSDLLIASTTGSAENKLIDFPIRRFTNKDQEVRTKYSIELFQQSLTPEAYRYYESLQRITDRQGSLSDIQPGNIRGNIIDDKGDYAIGYFTAMDEVSKRAFFTPLDFEHLVNIPFNYGCDLEILDGLELFDFMNQDTNSSEYLLHQYFDGAGWFVVRKECGDCSSYASPEQPIFWE